MALSSMCSVAVNFTVYHEPLSQQLQGEGELCYVSSAHVTTATTTAGKNLDSICGKGGSGLLDLKTYNKLSVLSFLLSVCQFVIRNKLDRLFVFIIFIIWPVPVALALDNLQHRLKH